MVSLFIYGNVPVLKITAQWYVLYVILYIYR
jgi:hypothetical protein